MISALSFCKTEKLMDYFFLETVSLIPYPLHPISLTFCSQDVKTKQNKTPVEKQHNLTLIL